MIAEKKLVRVSHIELSGQFPEIIEALPHIDFGDHINVVLDDAAELEVATLDRANSVLLDLAGRQRCVSNQQRRPLRADH